MLPCLLHLGFPRTATTTLQSSLERKPGNALFLGRGPEAMERRHDRWRSATVARAMATLIDADAKHEAAAEALHREVATATTERAAKWVIVSDERVSKPPMEAEPDWRGRLATRAAAMFSGAHVLLTVRRQEDLLKSLYGRYLQLRDPTTGAAPAFSAWLDEGGGSEYAHWGDRFDFFAFYEACAMAFGASCVHVADYEQFVRCPDLLPSLFRKVCAESTTHIDFSTRLNSGWMPRSGRGLLARVRSTFDGSSPSQQTITISESDLARIRARFAEGNARLGKATGLGNGWQAMPDEPIVLAGAVARADTT